MTHDPILRPEDLAPGDRQATSGAFDDVRVHRVRDANDADFDVAYGRLWREFGPRGEMETRRVIGERLDWDPARPLPHAALAYELLVLRRGDGTLAAVRDHTAVVRRSPQGAPPAGPVIVHLSHALVEPSQRGSGLVRWLRALPVQTARRCGRAAGLGDDAPIVLVAEMEPPDTGRDRMRGVRLRSYERAGFLKIDPASAPYLQPDFRSPEELGTRAPTPVPLSLVVRRVGREHETGLPAAEVEAIIESIYAVYAVHTPAAALDPLRAEAAGWLARAHSFRLLPPTT